MFVAYQRDHRWWFQLYAASKDVLNHCYRFYILTSAREDMKEFNYLWNSQCINGHIFCHEPGNNCNFLFYMYVKWWTYSLYIFLKINLVRMVYLARIRVIQHTLLQFSQNRIYLKMFLYIHDFYFSFYKPDYVMQVMA